MLRCNTRVQHDSLVPWLDFRGSLSWAVIQSTRTEVLLVRVRRETWPAIDCRGAVYRSADRRLLNLMTDLISAVCVASLGTDFDIL